MTSDKIQDGDCTFMDKICSVLAEISAFRVFCSVVKLLLLFCSRWYRFPGQNVYYLFRPIVTSAEGGYVFGSVCLFVCPSDNWKSCERILTKFLGGVGHGPGTNEFNFGDDADHRPDPGVWSPKSGFTGLSNSASLWRWWLAPGGGFWWNFMENLGVA